MNIEEFYNRHYIAIDVNGLITDGWSDGVRPDRDTSDAICINEQGGYQFQLLGEVNPPLHDYPSGAYLYRWDGTQVIKRTEEELAPEREAWQAEQTRLTKIAALKAQLAATDYKALKYFEGWISEAEYADTKAERQSLRDQINALEAETTATGTNE